MTAQGITTAQQAADRAFDAWQDAADRLPEHSPELQALRAAWVQAKDALLRANDEVELSLYLQGLAYAPKRARTPAQREERRLVAARIAELQAKLAK